MRWFKRIAFGFLILFASAFLVFAAVASRHYVVPIIMYHRVLPGATYADRLVVSVETFDRQMRFLKINRYNVITLEKLADLIRQKKKIPPKTVSITFDDGYEDNYTNAFPVLKKYGLAATLFVIVGEVGDRHKNKLSWEEIKQMQDSGIFSIGSHALGPEPLTNIKSREEISRQIFDSRRILKEQLGKEVNTFSYPEGGFDPRIRQLVIAAGYKAAVATHPGRDYPDDDIFALKRLRISENAGNLFVFWVETSGFYNFMKERR
ncbi:MAG: polysaccharide deacetylase family protein [Candidatus Omnitrophota bacterium]|nr:polysaccharide deacetylase family protein [Candidatus Omnitrophota bacterium]